MGNDFEFMISKNSEEYKNFTKIFGSEIIKIKSFIPENGIGPDGIERTFYKVDLSVLTNDQREKLIDYIVKRFKQERDFVNAELEERGFPIQAKHGTVIIHNPQRWI